MVAWCALASAVGLPEQLYHNQFAIHVPGGPAHAEDIARRHGYVNHGQVWMLFFF